MEEILRSLPLVLEIIASLLAILVLWRLIALWISLKQKKKIKQKQEHQNLKQQLKQTRKELRQAKRETAQARRKTLRTQKILKRYTKQEIE